MHENNLSTRTLKTSSGLTVFVTLMLFCAGRSGWAWGFVIGALLSVFSLFSLAVVVPMLFRPGAPRAMQAVLSLTLFMKLPLYALGLYLATHVRGIAPAGAGFGISLVPIVMTLKAIGEAILESLPQRAPGTAADPLVISMSASELEEAHPTHAPARAARTAHAEI